MTADEIARFRAGDPAIFRHVVTSYSPHLLSYACSLCGDKDAAGDLVQETFIHAFRVRAQFHGTGTLLGWLLTICRRRHQSEWRRWRRRTAALAHAFGPDNDAMVLPGEDHLTSGEAVAAVAALPARQREVILARVVEGWSTRETAERLNIAEGTVKATLHRALRALRHRLQGDSS